ncbi:alpha/beta fold hydrolase [Clostridium sp.]|uniref:alpha/beta hydrolase n=1 Tax=Clostridium sp. TaxID=1506 RepID=UPI00283BE2D7|nr:alpha/beta fold hydrolase [Clostridium sp.]MDR3594415.1 alpha/beta fold hydrolase [Clostridium sp.]
METTNLRNEFFFKGNDIGCLLIHGFSSTPAELRELGEKLMTEGYSVCGVKLKGHRTTLEDFESSKYNHWIDSVEGAYNKLKSFCSKIYVIGHSMGGVLTLNLAENHVVDKLVLLAPALITKDKTALLVPILKHFIKYTEWPPMKRPKEETKYLLGYSKIPLACIHELSKLQKITKAKLNKIDKPLLIIHSKKDNSIDEKGIELIEKEVASKEIKNVCLNKCGHNITVECEKETVFKEVIEFLK